MKQLINLLTKGVSPFHLVNESKKYLLDYGFEELKLEEYWYPQVGKGYFVSPSPSVLVAFTFGNGVILSQKPNIRIAAAHTDQPTFKIKFNPEINNNNYLQINVEPYGGAIYNTWLDRPLGIAGKVVLKSNNIFKPKVSLFDSKRPIAIIPNLAIHMNRDVNRGVELNAQNHMIPIIAILNKTLNKNNFLLNYIAKELEVNITDILDFDLYLYNTDKPEIVGINQEFLSSPRLDNIISVQALLDGIVQAERKQGINIIALFDNEEIGSRSKQGADSNILSFIIQKMFNDKNTMQTNYIQSLVNSMMLSVDVAHSLHPNYISKSDITNKVILGKGIALKSSANQKYVTDSEVAGAILQLCEKEEIKIQRAINRSDMLGGQTLGPIVSSYLPIKAVDIGVPMLAMHSARELVHIDDYQSLKDLIYAFFKVN